MKHVICDVMDAPVTADQTGAQNERASYKAKQTDETDIYGDLKTVEEVFNLINRTATI